MDNYTHKEVSQCLHSTALGFGGEPLLVTPNGHVLDLATGYIPLLVNFTFEDKAAKGPRKRTANDGVEPAVYFSALEMVRDHKILLLSGNSGSGKTTFAMHLSWRLATVGSWKSDPIPRKNMGVVHAEHWDAKSVIPWYFEIGSPDDLKTAVEYTLPKLFESLKPAADKPADTALIMLDVGDRVGENAEGLLKLLADRVKTGSNVKLLILGHRRITEHWDLPSDVARQSLLPLLEAQRQSVVAQSAGSENSQIAVGLGAAAATPALFALALEAGVMGAHGEELLDEWLAKVIQEKVVSTRLEAQAFERLKYQSLQRAVDILPSIEFEDVSPLLSRSSVVQQLLAARHPSQRSPGQAIDLFHSTPIECEPAIRSLLVRLDQSPETFVLMNGLTQGPNENMQRGALLVSDFGIAKGSEIWDRVRAQLLQIVETGTLSPLERKYAGQILSSMGDTRDLAALVEVNPGTFTMGSDTHPNGQPLATVSAKRRIRIGMYPVVNRDYLTFIQQTGRSWHSVEGRAPDKQNVPATSLTWHDARAYCSWLTDIWHGTGKIGPYEEVRLPTELEWERAARGNLPETGRKKPVYPWGLEWVGDTANLEETGFNEPCAVGLFPRGRSANGCFDMAGQVWEWCTSLWGDNMATPSFHHPYRNDDGREALDAPESVRRVLRGGCFSSGRLKVSCSYRGSLEPAGFWRGNGFRVVVDEARAM